MKKFHFPLEQVRNWRELELERERRALERCLEQEAAVRASREQLTREIEQTHRALFEDGGMTGATLHSFALMQQSFQQRERHLQTQLEECVKATAEQRQRYVAADRGFRLLDDLRERRRGEWQKDMDREIEQAAGESHLARLVRTRTVRLRNGSPV